MTLISESMLLAMIRATKGTLDRIIVNGVTIQAHFDNGYLESLDAPGVEGRQPYLTCRTSDLVDVQKDQQVEVGTEQYRVKRLEPDGAGITRVLLRR